MAMGERKIIADINITPLTDIFLVLLIIMMVVTPLLDFTGLSASLGSADAPAAAQDDKKPLAIEVTAEGPYRVAGEKVAPEAMGEKLRDAPAAKTAGIILDVDPMAPLDRLTRIMDLCQSTGITQISISESAPESQTAARPSPRPAPTRASKPKP